MASEPTVPRDVRPVVAAGLCLIALILAWPLVRSRDDGGAGSEMRADEDTPGGAAVAQMATVASPATDAPAPSSVKPVRRAPAVPAPLPSRRPEGGAGAPQPKTGIGVFPPPGTDPPKAGIIVPDDYELPPGYVRHYQTTDDGKQLPPILMFHPDFQPVDDRGRPIPLPADRVVPPDMAPPGLPHDMLHVPPTHVPFVEDPPR